MPTERAMPSGKTVGATPTEQAPEPGVIQVEVGDRVFPLSEIEHWVEDGVHVFRSTEFDLLAEAEDEFEAVTAFIQTAEDVLRFLDDVFDAGRATPDEIRTLVKLSRRFHDVYDALRDEVEQHRRRLAQAGTREIHSANWQRRTTPASSSPRVPA